MKLLAALEAGDVRIPAMVAKLPERGDRPREPFVATAEKQVKHGADHKMTLRSES